MKPSSCPSHHPLLHGAALGQQEYPVGDSKPHRPISHQANEPPSPVRSSVTRVQIPATEADERPQARGSSQVDSWQRPLRVKDDWSVQPRPSTTERPIDNPYFSAAKGSRVQSAVYKAGFWTDYKRKTRTKNICRVKFRDAVPCRPSLARTKLARLARQTHAAYTKGYFDLE
ncbi:hypothetical protein GGS20DRAFT_499893 [Poronia punctata]|nr:hypothetical protein GGS20DRAFT_499893 [Poronia punctata]